MKNQLALRITGFCSIAAGLLHFSIVAMLHWTPFPPLEGMFFIVGGTIQFILGVRFLHKPTVNTYRLGLSMNGGMAILCIVMQYLPVPFIGESEAMGSLAMLVVSLELIAVGTSLRWLHTHERHGEGRRVHVTLATAFSVILLWGAGFYGGAQGVAILMPDRNVEHHHYAEEGHLPPKIIKTGDNIENTGTHKDDTHSDEDKDEGHGH